MDKVELYEKLVNTEIGFADLIEPIPAEKYQEYRDYIMQRMESTYAFPDDNPELGKGKPMIPVNVRMRLGITWFYFYTVQWGFSQKALDATIEYYEKVQQQRVLLEKSRDLDRVR